MRRARVMTAAALGAALLSACVRPVDVEPTGPTSPVVSTQAPASTSSPSGTSSPSLHETDLPSTLRVAISFDQPGVGLREGVYAGLLGPTYETPAEVRMLRMLGADAVGMSTVPEIIALRHMGVPAAAISCITNLAAGITGAELSHAEVEETAKRSRTRFVELLSTWVRKAGAEAARWGAGS